MRFMILVRATEETEAGVLASHELLEPDDFGDALTPELRAAEDTLRNWVSGR